MSQRAAEIDIFLSYKREERTTAKALAEVLAARGYSLWWDIDLLPGDRFVDAVTEVIKRARVTIVLWSEQAVASDYVRGEAEVARQAGKLIPARLDDCGVPIPFNALQTVDLRRWKASRNETPLAPLVAALEKRLGNSTEASQPGEATEAKLHTSERDAALWRSVERMHSIPEYEYYLENFPRGLFADLARRRIKTLREPDIGKTILKLGAIAGAIAAAIGLFVLVREEFWPALSDIWTEPQRTATEAGAVPAGADAEDREIVAPAVGPMDQDSLYQPGDKFRDCNECPEMVVVPPGSFLMGSPEGEEGRDDDEGPQHLVTIAEPFAISVYEVTFEEWTTCFLDGGCNGYRPDDEGWGRDTRPVINISWDDARSFVGWLSERTDRDYRLPSEAEWEYAARADTTTPFHFGPTISTDLANYNGNFTYGSGQKGANRVQTAPVGSFPINGFGLESVHGNVWEWVEDCWEESFAGAGRPDDGTAWTKADCDRHVLRGGSWSDFPKNLRAAERFSDYSDDRSIDYGFRVARSLSE